MKIFDFFIGIVLIMFSTGCTKPDDDPVPVPAPTPPQAVAPSGVIKEFYMVDTIVPFNKGTTAKWNVTEANDKTVVTFDGVIVGLYGVLETGRLKQATNYTLMVNNGAKRIRTVLVYDSVTTAMWNEGKRWKQTNFETYERISGQPDTQWVAHMTDSIGRERTMFQLNGDSYIQSFGISVLTAAKSTGKFVIYTGGKTFGWKSTVYTILTLDNTEFITSYKTTNSNGSKTTHRNTYKME